MLLDCEIQVRVACVTQEGTRIMTDLQALSNATTLVTAVGGGVPQSCPIAKGHELDYHPKIPHIVV
jgi:hypothetical protein